MNSSGGISGTGKYVALTRYLRALPARETNVTLLFRNLESILAFSLPPSARKYRPWWANQKNNAGRPQAQGWTDAGFVVDSVNVSAGTVRFARREGVAVRSMPHVKMAATANVAQPQPGVPESGSPNSGPRQSIDSGMSRRTVLVSCAAKKQVQLESPTEALRPARNISRQETLFHGSSRQSRVPKLITEFPRFLQIFALNPPFTRIGQLENHVKTIRIRRKLGSATRTLADDGFLDSLYATLQAWGIGKRASQLLPLDQFVKTLRARAADIAAWDEVHITDPTLNVGAVSAKLWRLIDTLGIVANNAKIVPGTKALHHILPDLVVPVDRAYTQKFFGWHSPQFQYDQAKVFCQSFAAFVEIARSVNPVQYVGTAWNSSPTKVIDNALVGLLCEEEKG